MTLILRSEDIKKCIKMRDVIKAVEQAFKEHAKQLVQMPPKIYIELAKGDYRAMPAYAGGAVGMKWISAYPDNPKLKKKLPSVIGLIILNDPKTSYPLAILDGTLLTSYRTGASAAIASKVLARKDSASLGLIGCGAQARTQVLAISEFFDLEEIRAYDICSDSAERLKNALPEYNIASTSIKDAAKCDVVSTLTPSRKPVVKREWVSAGTHINAMGADAHGKEELDPKILLDAKVVVDDIEQAEHGGEINVPVSEGIFSMNQVYATLGEILIGKKKGREGSEMTVFDSTGLAIHDIVTARVIYEKAKKMKLGTEIEIVG
jgi:alanine dehydrogenase